MFKTLSKVLRYGEGKKIKELENKAALVTEFEPQVAALNDDELKAKMGEFKKRYQDGQTLEELLPEVFAVVREASKRSMKMRHFDVQIMGGIVLFEGKISEMKTGEGKTLVATLPLVLNSITGKTSHLVTVNDYLAKRDRAWMAPVYNFLGVTVGLIQADMMPDERRKAYQCDIVYGTNSEFGFDYLRDNMAISLEEKVQTGHHFAIVDEVDSILIDEARTPLIISGPAEQAAKTYRQFARIVPRLKENEDYEVDEKDRAVSITESGIAKVESALNIKNLYDHLHTNYVNHLQQALKAKALFKKDVDYVVKDGEVIIVDEFTGRLMEGRRYSEGLHQAIEAKEQVAVREENQTIATITLQNYFRMYKKLAGMTGTAITEADEFMHIYKLECMEIPTNKPMVRKDFSDVIYKTEEIKFKAVADDIAERSRRGQPVLVGTVSIEKSERLSRLLKQRGIRHEVLNAKYHEREADIIAQAGKKGAVTVATNMAGRGVDIVLGGNPADKAEQQKVLAQGGLHIIGTERHESRRIDNQLRGRSGRQGDPGSSLFYLSTEDDLMRLFAADRIKAVMERFNLPDDQPIEAAMLSKIIENAQKQVESINFSARKHLLEYDDIVNKQREIIYEERDKVLAGGSGLIELAISFLEEIILATVDRHINEEVYAEDWDIDGLLRHIKQFIPHELSAKDFKDEELTPLTLKDKFNDIANQGLEQRKAQLGEDGLAELIKVIMLQVIDHHWKDYLDVIHDLQEGIGLRAMGQRDPLVEFKAEAYDMFQQLMGAIKEDFAEYIFHVEIAEAPVSQLEQATPVFTDLTTAPGASMNMTAQAAETTTQTYQAKSDKVGRNEPCPCGSGKKYKKCCGQ
ncbi:MAG: preprotein translocase subunit SecA [Actinobacteria bacterium]|nr:MAG: preprotein translocase subunit SecA [Actinomycetota bacterium]